MHMLLLLLISMMLSVTPINAQGNRSDFYQGKYGAYGSAQPKPHQAPAPNFTGQPSPSNLPDASMNGFGEKSHWLDRPGAVRNTGTLSGQVEALLQKHAAAKSRGDLVGANQANAALKDILRQLTSMEPREAKWKVLKATTYINQAGGASRSGTAGDRFSLQQALRELDLAAACPDAGQYRLQIESIRVKTEQELNRRVAKGLEIQRRGARQFAEIYNMPGGQSVDNGPTLCTVCGRPHRSGECTYRRD